MARELSSLFRGMLIVVLAILLIGFGLCSALGLVNVVGTMIDGHPIVAWWALVLFPMLGIALCLLCWRGIQRLRRASARPVPERP